MSAELARGIAHLLGWLAAAALCASLGTSLAARWTSRALRGRLVASRRLLGLAGLALGLAHALVVVPSALAPPRLAELLPMVEALPYLRHGALALALLAPLGATSFPSLNARLGLRAWSTLHRLVYAASALVALHVVAGPGADPRLALALAALLAALLLARLVPARRRAEPGLTTGSPDNP